MCINQVPANTGNFLRWHECTDLFLPLASPPELCALPGTPAGYQVDLVREQGVFALPVVNGDVIRFVINTPVTLFPAGVAGLSVGLVRDLLLVAPNAGTLTDAGGYVYGTIAINNLVDRMYWPVIYRTATKQMLFVGNPLQGVTRRAWRRDTLQLRFSHPQNLRDFRFADVPGLYCQFRLPAWLYDMQGQTDFESYRDMNNRLRVVGEQHYLRFRLSLDFADDETHKAMLLALACKTLTLNDRSYIKTAGYEIAPQESQFNLRPGSVKLEDLDYAKNMRAC